MFLFQETYYVTPGLQDVIDGRVRSLHENHALSPEFVAADWMKYLGDETTYLAFRLWSSRDVTYSEEQRKWMAEYNRQRPSDAFTRPPDIDYFEQIRQDGVMGDAAFALTADLRFGGRSAAMDLEDTLRRDLSSTDGFREYRLCRFMGGENRFLRAEFWASQEAARAFWHHPARREFMGELAIAATRGMPVQRSYAVLHQLGDARMR